MKKMHHNILDGLESKATISTFGCNYGKPGTGYFSISSLIVDLDKDMIKKWEYLSKNVDHIIEYMEQKGFRCELSKDGYNSPVIRCTHIDTQEEIDRILSERNLKFTNAEKGFIRFGDIPMSGYSINHSNNTPEKGVSVFEAEFSGNEYRILGSKVELFSHLMIKDRPVYRIYGEVVGIGGDGEPVLKVEKVVKL